MPGQYNPETILNEQFRTQEKQLQHQFQIKWDAINRQARTGMFKSQKEYEQSLHEVHVENQQIMSEFASKYEQATNQLKQIDTFAEQGVIPNPDEIKMRLILGPEAEAAVFPQQRDPRLEHPRNLKEQNELMDIRASFVIDNGRLYAAKTKKDGNTLVLTDKADKNEPATQEQIRTWAMAEPALAALVQEEQDIIGQMSETGMPDPAYLQSLYTSQRRKGFWKKWWEATSFRMRGGTLEELKRMRAKAEFGTQPTGTFAQKVQQDIARPQIRQSQAQPQTGKKSRQELLAEYNKLGGSGTPEGRAFADRNLR